MAIHRHRTQLRRDLGFTGPVAYRYPENRAAHGNITEIAGSREYAAAGVPWPGCSCGADECAHGLAHYWVESGEFAGLAVEGVSSVVAPHVNGGSGVTEYDHWVVVVVSYDEEVPRG